jgi:hypothetical protein
LHKGWFYNYQKNEIYYQLIREIKNENISIWVDKNGNPISIGLNIKNLISKFEE